MRISTPTTAGKTAKEHHAKLVMPHRRNVFDLLTSMNIGAVMRRIIEIIAPENKVKIH
jgi:hypothetical protein